MKCGINFIWFTLNENLLYYTAQFKESRSTYFAKWLECLYGYNSVQRFIIAGICVFLKLLCLHVCHTCSYIIDEHKVFPLPTIQCWKAMFLKQNYLLSALRLYMNEHAWIHESVISHVAWYIHIISLYYAN